MDEAAIGTTPAGPHRCRTTSTESDSLTRALSISRCPLLWSVLLLAALAGEVHALPTDAEQPIHFRADNVEGDLAAGGLPGSRANGASPAGGPSTGAPTKRVIATGSVQVDQGSMRLEADRVVIESDGDRIVLINAEGDLARYRQQLEPGAAFVEARAAKIIYHPVDERIELVGRAWLARDNDEFRGEVIQFDMREGKVLASGEKDGVEMILQPESLQRSPQPGSARENPSHEKSSAREHPSQENTSARERPSQENNP